MAMQGVRNHGGRSVTAATNAKTPQKKPSTPAETTIFSAAAMPTRFAARSSTTSNKTLFHCFAMYSPGACPFPINCASHVYNAWLAQLIGKGQAPGLYIAKQWNNVLFDVALLRAANLVGMAAAQKIVVSACVLIFFWGVFAFVAAVTERPPWFLTPCIAMLAYGYPFNMGFMN